MAHNREEKIRRRAYQLWEQGGRRSGNAEEYWFQAEVELRKDVSVDLGLTAASDSIGKHTGKCFCGAIEVVATGEPLTMGYCHCTSCRQWSASPVNAFTIWVPESVRITKGAESVASFRKTSNTVRKWCRACGGHLLTERPLWLVTEVPAAILPTYRSSQPFTCTTPKPFSTLGMVSPSRKTFVPNLEVRESCWTSNHKPLGPAVLRLAPEGGSVDSRGPALAAARRRRADRAFRRRSGSGRGHAADGRRRPPGAFRVQPHRRCAQAQSPRDRLKRPFSEGSL